MKDVTGKLFCEWLDAAKIKIPGLKIVVADLETTVQDLGGKTDNTPFNRNNRAVSGHFLKIENGEVGPVRSLVWHHDEQATPDNRDELQEALDWADVFVAHNAKFDAIWLLEMGFRLPETIICTMIIEFVLARGQFIPLSLAEVSVRRDVTHKKGELVEEMFKNGIGFEKMPLATVLEYAEADVVSCAEVFLSQVDDLAHPDNNGLSGTVDLMCEMLQFLVEIERNGIQIDLDVLAEIEQLFSSEKAAIEQRLEDIVRTVMGDTPINLNSGPDMTKVVFSREVTDRNLHRDMFNIGTSANGKPLPTPRMKPSEFAAAVRATTKVVNKTVVEVCPLCNGSGEQVKYTKKGELYKKQPKCKVCSGEGAIYVSTGQKAGLKLVPESPRDASINGFKVDKTSIKRLVEQAKGKGNDVAVEFLTKLSRLNALNTYLSSFVIGIQNWTREDSILHANFNQTVAKTGRLSSSNPNFQNQPKGGKFPVRKAVVSRFRDGLIIEADFSGLEFRVAGILSKDPQIIEDIMSGKDVHKQTASIINRCDVSEVTKDMRQGAKAYTFAPLYGGMGATEPDHIQTYFKQYFNIYKGLGVWHKKLMAGVLKDGIVRIPSGREFYFPGARRLGNGRITNATAVVNYPVQSHATGDCVPLACIRVLHRFRELGLRSKIILTVHDSIVVDCHPDEVHEVCDALEWGMAGLNDAITSRWGYVPDVPLTIEIEGGKNWMEMQEVGLLKVSSKVSLRSELSDNGVQNEPACSR